MQNIYKIKWKLHLFSAALLVLTTASARTWIVASHLLADDNRTGFLLLQIQRLLGLLVEDVIPHRKIIKPVCLRLLLQ